MWSRVCSSDHAPLTVMPCIIFFFKIKNCLNDDLFISRDDRIGKMLHNICISAVAMSLRWATRGPWASCLIFCIILSRYCFGVWLCCERLHYFCSKSFLAAKYVMLLVTFIFITAFTFIQSSHLFDLETWFPRHLTHFLDFTLSCIIVKPSAPHFSHTDPLELYIWFYDVQTSGS